MWGMNDIVSPVRVADYLWDAALKPSKASAAYCLVPYANHYLRHDQPVAMARVVRLALGKWTAPASYNLGSPACDAVLVKTN